MNNYQRGRAKEQYLKKKYQKQGYLVLRSAASKGFADLVCIKDEEVRFIQSKPRHFNKKEKQRLEEKYSWINNERMCRFVVE